MVSFKPCQSAQTRELASMRNASGNDSSIRVLNLDIKAEAFFKPKSYIYIYDVVESKRRHLFAVTLSFAPKPSSDRSNI